MKKNRLHYSLQTGPLKFWPEMEYLLRQLFLIPEREPHADRVIEFVALALAKSGNDRFIEHVLNHLSNSKVCALGFLMH